MLGARVALPSLRAAAARLPRAGRQSCAQRMCTSGTSPAAPPSAAARRDVPPSLPRIRSKALEGAPGSGGSSAGGRHGGRLDEDVPRIAGMMGAAAIVPFLWYAFQHEPLPTHGAASHAPRGDAVLTKVGAYLPFAPMLACGDQATLRRRFVTYASTGLTFLGAVHWGAAMNRPPLHAPTLLASAAPALAAWAALNADVNSSTPLTLLGASYLALYMVDEATVAKRAVPAWYTYLRTPMTVAIVASIGVAMQFSKL